MNSMIKNVVRADVNAKYSQVFFVDTEFSDFDKAEFLSMAVIGDSGKLYLQRTPPFPTFCSPFVHQNVLSQFDSAHIHLCEALGATVVNGKMRALRMALKKFLRQRLGSTSIQLVIDEALDLKILNDMLDEGFYTKTGIDIVFPSAVYPDSDLAQETYQNWRDRLLQQEIGLASTQDSAPVLKAHHAFFDAHCMYEACKKANAIAL